MKPEFRVFANQDVTLSDLGFELLAGDEIDLLSQFGRCEILGSDDLMNAFNSGALVRRDENGNTIASGEEFDSLFESERKSLALEHGVTFASTVFRTILQGNLSLDGGYYSILQSLAVIASHKNAPFWCRLLIGERIIREYEIPISVKEGFLPISILERENLDAGNHSFELQVKGKRRVWYKLASATIFVSLIKR